jgi:hypothetical protein
VWSTPSKYESCNSKKSNYTQGTNPTRRSEFHVIIHDEHKLECSMFIIYTKPNLPLIVLSIFALALVSISSLQGQSISNPTPSSALCYPEGLEIFITARWAVTGKQHSRYCTLFNTMNLPIKLLRELTDLRNITRTVVAYQNQNTERKCDNITGT